MRPVARRTAAVVLCALLVLVVPATAAKADPTRKISAENALEGAVLAEVNALRSRSDLAPLRISSQLSAAADVHSKAMAERGFFSHMSADGSAFWRRVQRHYGSEGFAYWSVGENLLWASATLDAPRAIRMWLDSAPHKKNLLAPQWREIGLSAVRVPSAPGTFNGLDVTIVTADFGVRR
jgi:uncharacterized protein YkwD